MKKLVSAMLIMAMSLTVAACGASGNDTGTATAGVLVMATNVIILFVIQLSNAKTVRGVHLVVV